MNDRFKFRAWDGKRMSFIGISFNNSIGVLSSPDNNLMQCTGLKDKNGKLIFEGDIVKAHYFSDQFGSVVDCEFMGQIKFIEEMQAWVIWKSDENWIFIYETTHFDTSESIEVLGDIYQYPDLLNESKK